MEIKYKKDISEYTFDFMNKLSKGDCFDLNNKKHTVKCLGTCTLVKRKFKTLTVISESGQIKFYYVGGISGNPTSMGRNSHNKQNNFLRNVEGVILVDILNQNNPLHDFSEIFKIAIQ